MGIKFIFIFSLVNANAEMGDFNLFNIYSSINNDCSVGDENIFHQYASAINGVSVGDNKSICAGEVLFDSIDNDIIFQSGIEFQMTKVAVMQPYIFPYLDIFSS